MKHDLPLKCACGAVSGTVRGVSARTVNRLVCCCEDCQAFARYLGGEANLDSSGGTDISQLSPAQVVFTDGVEHIACLRLSSSGLARWYTSCCRTPIGNTPASASPPFLGLIHCIVDSEGHGRSRDEVMGPVRNPSPGGRVPVRVIARALTLMLRWWLRGDSKRSPFFDPHTGAPRVAPLVWTPEARLALHPPDSSLARTSDVYASRTSAPGATRQPHRRATHDGAEGHQLLRSTEGDPSVAQRNRISWDTHGPRH